MTNIEKENIDTTKKVVLMNDEAYLLMSSDSTGMLITHVQLKENKDVNNYDEWSSAIELMLEAKEKLGFINGTIVKPEEDDPKLKKWWSMNTMIGSGLLNTIQPSLHSSI